MLIQTKQQIKSLNQNLAQTPDAINEIDKAAEDIPDLKSGIDDFVMAVIAAL